MYRRSRPSARPNLQVLSEGKRKLLREDPGDEEQAINPQKHSQIVKHFNHLEAVQAALPVDQLSQARNSASASAGTLIQRKQGGLALQGYQVNAEES